MKTRVCLNYFVNDCGTELFKGLCIYNCLIYVYVYIYIYKETESPQKVTCTNRPNQIGTKYALFYKRKL